MTETTSTLSLGERLKSTRESLDLTINDIVKHTNLKKVHLEAIEQDIFILPNVPPAFVRGYVGSYLRFLRLPEELVNSVNYGEVTIPKQVVKAAPIPVKNSPKSQGRWVKNLTWLILLGAIGMTLTWWWQEYKKDQISNQQLVSTQVENTAAENAVPVVVQSSDVTTSNVQTVQPVVIEAPKAETVQTVQSQPEPTQVEQPQVVAPAVEMPKVEEPKVEAQPVVEVQSQPAQEAVVQTPVQEATVQVVEPVNVLQQTAEVAQPQAEETTESQQIVGDAELRIEITNAQSWITVRGEKNKKLAEKLYSAGEVLTFSDNAQYRLTVGAPANVKIYYKGQQVPLKVDGRVARFKLPLAN